MKIAKIDRWNAWSNWERWHNHDIEILAITTGVSVRTIQRWRSTRNVPQWVALMSTQIFRGTALPVAGWRIDKNEAIRKVKQKLGLNGTCETSQ
ncbi:MAG: hypothetical protein M0P19_07935 [Nevskia sp.]|nr:hypothetical protein [Nevskia sp.]MCK9386478.1 hypothetical protein [Nevskia sp.]